MDHAAPRRDDPVAQVRAFNRFYTRQIGLLEDGLHRSAFSLTEARVLYELAHRDGLTASALGRGLGLDAGYLSRMLRRFEADGHVTRTASAADGRRQVLALTASGRAAFAPLDRASREEIGALLERLSAADRAALLAAMGSVQRLLGAPAEAPATRLRDLAPGDIGWITHRQGLLYAQEYGFDLRFEALVAEILAAFVKDFDPDREQAWIAERGAEVAGSVLLVRQSDRVAKLRLLYVEPAARGEGLGRRLVEACVAGARARGYATLMLWTNDVLTAAGRLYRSAGFRLVDSEPHRSFGQDLVGQTWRLDL
ncbi:dTDP-fucosamine acetyltransferase [Methylobacterium crusticola]|uniref:dTDP-fucosamine acetyltransferase n=1 Tax=Methylobacterium crusticola TaxID=1697972 RepID=A0ABQ4QTY7_9HYPH|nr:bifunctional helix-turn-helix transcriptional regulator/GNAT family N-acetyltransferase [Methylobacterium crusticola]GJD48521.1 dTDP-fucosamine acetyltransferase [Methylobacterium crusticola]